MLSLFTKYPRGTHSLGAYNVRQGARKYGSAPKQSRRIGSSIHKSRSYSKPFYYTGRDFKSAYYNQHSAYRQHFLRNVSRSRSRARYL